LASTLELVLLYLIAAVLGVVVCRSLKLPPMLGYLVVGVVIGPNALAFAQDSASVHWLVGNQYFSRKLSDTFDFLPGAPSKLPEAKSDPLFAYFGMIHVYNFLADSFRMNRLNDAGYLLGRLMVNKDGRAMMEGHEKLTRPISSGAVDEALLKEWVQQAILYAMNFDLMAAPFEGLDEVSVAQFLDMSGQLKLRTAKKLGFKPY
jgi:hypothetical protein